MTADISPQQMMQMMAAAMSQGQGGGALGGGAQLPPVLAQHGQMPYYEHLISGIPWLGRSPFAIFLYPYIQQLLAKAGTIPGSWNDRNMLDVLQLDAFRGQWMAAQRAAAQADREIYIQGFRGITTGLLGIPWGPAQIRAAEAFADAAVSMAPTLNMFFPQWMDTLLGTRGSAALMMANMMPAMRYRIDPSSGRLGGITADVASSVVQQIYRDLYVVGDLRNMRGIGAGQLGQLFAELSSRGLISGLLDPRETLAELMRQGEGPTARMVRQILRQPAGEPVDLAKLTMQDVERLATNPEVQREMQSLNINKIKTNLTTYIDALAAVKEIFGAEGEPDAPMPKLLAALDALTGGGLGRIGGAQITNIVRMTQQLAQMAGISMSTVMQIQQGAAQQARSMGMDTTMAPLATQHALAWTAAYRGGGFGATPVWGASSADELMIRGQRLFLQAAASPAAQRMAVLLRLHEQGAFRPGSQAEAYAEALRRASETGVSYWTDPVTGKVRDFAMDQDEWRRMIQISSIARIEDNGLVRLLLQRTANEEIIARNNLPDVVRSLQWRDVANQMSGSLAKSLRISGIEVNMAKAREMMGAILHIDPKAFGDTEQRTAAIADIIAKHTGVSAEQARQAALQVYPDLAEAAPYVIGAPFIDVFRLVSPRIQQIAAINSVLQRMELRARTSLAGVTGGGVMRRIMEQVIEAGKGDSDLVKIITGALPTVSAAEAQQAIVPLMQKMQSAYAEYRKGMEKLARAQYDPKEMQNVQAYRQQLEQLTDALVQTEIQLAGALQAHLPSSSIIQRSTVERAKEVSTNVREAATKLGAAPKSPEEITAYLATDQGKTFAAAVRDMMTLSGEIIAQAKITPIAISAYGPDTMRKIAELQEIDLKMQKLADRHAGGDIARLLAAGNSEARQLQAQRQKLLEDISKRIVDKFDWTMLPEEVREEVLQRSEAIKLSSSQQRAALKLAGALSQEEIETILTVETALPTEEQRKQGRAGLVKRLTESGRLKDMQDKSDEYKWQVLTAAASMRAYAGAQTRAAYDNMMLRASVDVKELLQGVGLDSEQHSKAVEDLTGFVMRSREGHARVQSAIDIIRDVRGSFLEKYQRKMEAADWSRLAEAYDRYQNAQDNTAKESALRTLTEFGLNPEDAAYLRSLGILKPGGVKIEDLVQRIKEITPSEVSAAGAALPSQVTAVLAKGTVLKIEGTLSLDGSFSGTGVLDASGSTGMPYLPTANA